MEPTILKDIMSGSDGSSPDGYGTLDDVLYFSADNGSSGSELWKSDGTTSGTVLVKDINSGSNSSYPSQFIEMNGYLYFNADDGSTGNELWRTDGTVGGTTLVKDIRSGSGSSSPTAFAVMNNVLYFSADNGSVGAELWKSDGTSDGTQIVKDIAISGGSTPQSLTVINSTLFFSAFFGGQGRELWKSDGTGVGTSVVKDIRSGSLGSEPSSFKKVGSTLFFQADNGSVGAELWISDGSSGGTTLVKDIYSGSSSGSPSAINGIVIGSTLYFGVSDGVSSNSYVLWKSDGTSDGTTLVKNVYFGNAILVGSTIYFSGDDGTYGQELWKSDGTTSGTVLVKDILSGSSSSSPEQFVLTGSTLYFRAYTDDQGYELWKSDGTASSTSLVKDINPDSNDGNPSDFTVLTDYIIFEAEEDTYGEELWVLDFSDSEAPSLNVSDLSTNPTTDTTPTFTGSTTDSISTISSVQFQVDGTGGSWSSCTADDGTFDETSESFSCTTATLSAGTHTVYFRSTDSNSNISSNASKSVTIDATAPSISLSALSPDPTTDTTPTLTGTATDSSSTVASVRFQVDGTSGTWSNCTASDGAFDESSESFSCTSSLLEEGEHTMYVRATDNGGNVTASGSYASDTFTIDASPSYMSAEFPSSGLYIRQQRPTFKFRASAGSINQFSSYTISARHADGTGFTIPNIPVNAPSLSTTRYTISSTGFGDNNAENDYIFITTTSSPDWDSSSNDGRLKEGENTWTMTAHESNSNTVSVGHTFYVDVTKPQIDNVAVSSLGIVDGYLLSTLTRPKITFSFSDNVIPYKYAVDIYKQNYVLGIETGRTLISTETVTPILDEGQLFAQLVFTPQQNIPYGKYLFILTGYDKADNTSDISSMALQLLSQEKAEELLGTQVKDNKNLSIPELEKKAILRRQKEAEELEILLGNIRTTSDKVDKRIVGIANTIYSPLSFVFVNTQKTLGLFVQNIDGGISYLVDVFNLPPLHVSQEQPLEERIIALHRSEHQRDTYDTPVVDFATDKVKEKFQEHHSASNKKIQELFAAASITLHSLREPVNTVSDFASKISAGTETFFAIVFDQEPTRISNVSIEEIGTDYVTISWETNHPATGKVNFGQTLSYGDEVHLDKLEKKHVATLKGLTPGKKYFFEVMSQGKNYAYDAFYTVETLIEEKEQELPKAN